MTAIVATCVLSAGLLAPRAQEQGVPAKPPAAQGSVNVPEPPAVFIGQQPPARVRNVRLEVAVILGAGTAPEVLYSMTQVMGADGRRNSFGVNRPVLVRDDNYQRVGMRLSNMTARIEGNDLVVGFNLGFEVPAGGTPVADQAEKTLPAEIEQMLSLKLESGKRTTVLSTDAPGVEGPVVVQMTATLLNP